MMALDFGEACDDFEQHWTFVDSLESFLAARGIPPVYLSIYSGPELLGHPSPTKLGGVVVHGASTVLGLRAWDDAYEGVMARSEAQSAPWVLFDLEKIVRMMLHQSGLAFEMLATPLALSEGSPLRGARGEARTPFPAHRIVEAAVHQGVLGFYHDRADSIHWDERGLEHDEYRLQIVDAIRCALTGLELVEGRVRFCLSDLVAGFEETELAEVVDALQRDEAVSGDQHRYIRDRLAGWSASLADPSATALGEQPADYEWLDEFVVEQRLQRRDA